jgi:hypothetical protein
MLQSSERRSTNLSLPPAASLPSSLSPTTQQKTPKNLSLMNSKMDKRGATNLREETSVSTNSMGSGYSNKEITINDLLLKHSDHSIQTRNGDIRNERDVISWLDKHDKTHEFFRVHVDFHVMMEHIMFFLQGSTLKSLDMMEKCHKAKLRTIGEAIVVSSFDRKIPVLFHSSKNTSHHIQALPTDTITSCFNSIPSPDDFDSFQQMLRQGLFDFGIAHQRMVEDCYYDSDSELFRLASQSLTESIDFAEGLMNFMDRTFKVYSAPTGLDQYQAWHLTTLLAKRLIEFVAEPRVYVTATWTVGDLADINRRITMATIRSLEKMRKVSSLQFENLPCVHVELARFFFKIVSPEAIETLQSTAEELKEDLSGMTPVSTNSRKAAELLHQQIQMKKHVDALVDGVAVMRRYLTTKGISSSETISVKGCQLQSQFLCIYRWQVATTKRRGSCDSFDTQHLDWKGIE